MDQMPDWTSVRIRCVPLERRRQTLQQILEQSAPGESSFVLDALLGANAVQAFPVDGLLEAIDDNRSCTMPAGDSGPAVLGAVFGYPLPGRQAVVYPAYVTHDGNPRVAQGLHARLDQWLTDAGCCVSQVILGVRDPLLEERLAQVGYEYLATLGYMSWVPGANSPAVQPSDLDFVPLTARSWQALETVVEATYPGSLDCPGIDGLRTVKDVLDGYQQTGEFSSDRWFLVERSGMSVGCLLLTAHAHRQWELIYMGVVPSARGGGCGATIARFACGFCHRHGAEQIVLAVDDQNLPARNIYRRLGFQESVPRHVYVRSLKTPLPDVR